MTTHRTMARQTVLVMNMFSSLACHALGCSHSQASNIRERPDRFKLRGNSSSPFECRGAFLFPSQVGFAVTRAGLQFASPEHCAAAMVHLSTPDPVTGVSLLCTHVPASNITTKFGKAKTVPPACKLGSLYGHFFEIRLSRATSVGFK